MNRTVEAFLSKYLEQLKVAFKPQEIWLWGSYAYGQPNANSDIDIALVSKEFDKYRFIKRGAEVANRLKTWSDKELPDVDFLCYTPQEFAQKKKEVSLVRQIIQKGIRLV